MLIGKQEYIVIMLRDDDETFPVVEMNKWFAEHLSVSEVVRVEGATTAYIPVLIFNKDFAPAFDLIGDNGELMKY